MRTPILGIVIPTKNESENINELLDSLLPQVPYNATVIVSDDSDDDTIEKVMEYQDDRIQIINGGSPARSRNRGAKYLESEYILFIDPDVVLPKKLIKKSIKSLKKEKLDLLTCKVRTKGKWYYNIFFRINNFVMKISKFDKPFAFSGYFIVKRKKFEKLGGFSEQLNHCEDYWLSKKINPGKFKVLNSNIYTSTRIFNNLGLWGFFKQYFKSIYNRNNKTHFL